MEPQTVRMKVLVGAGLAVAAGLAIFVVAPWLAAQGPVDETAEPVPLSVAISEYEGGDGASVKGIDSFGVMPLLSGLPQVPEHPVLGAATGLPPLLVPPRVAAALPEQSEATKEPRASGIEAMEAVEAMEPTVAEPPILEVAQQSSVASQDESPAPEFVESPAVQVAESTHAAPLVAAVGIRGWQASDTPTRRLEFDLLPEKNVFAGPDETHFTETPLKVNSSRTSFETAAAEPSPGAPTAAAHLAGQAGPLPPGLPPRPAERLYETTLVPRTLRGVMGYRLPLVSRQEVPDQVVSGVLIPSHTTYVILRPGYWDLVDLLPDEVRSLQDAADNAKAVAEEPAETESSRGWSPLRWLRTKRIPQAEQQLGQTPRR